MTDLVDGRYEIGPRIAGGGMATVWRARDVRLGRDVALKRPRSDLAVPSVAARFRREAQLSARHTHPHLVTVFDAGEDELGPYLVMEYVEGPTLASTMRAVPRAEVFELGGQIASALATLHAAGTVHGDVKPGNIIMSARGPLLVDFGVATAAGGEGLEPDLLLATPGYAAPEVVSGQPRSPASDVFALAVTMGELLTGLRPDADESLPPGEPAIGDVLDRALSSDPATRPSAPQLAATLPRVSSAATRPVTPITPPMAPPPSQTVPMPVDAHPVPPPAPPPTEPPSSTRSAHSDPRSHLDRRRARARLFRLAVVGVVLAILVFAMGLLDGDRTARPAAADSDGTTPPPSAVQATVDDTPTTDATPSSETTESGADSGLLAAAADRLDSFIDSIRPPDLKPKISRAIQDRIDTLIEGGSQNVVDELEQLRDEIHAIEDRTLRAEAEALFQNLVEQLGVEISDG